MVLLQQFFLVFRVIGTTLLVLYIPGYVFSLILFTRNTIGETERCFVSFIASVVLSSLAGSIMTLSPGGLHPMIFALTIIALTMSFAFGVILSSKIRRQKNIAHEFFGLNKQGNVNWKPYAIVALLILTIIAPISIAPALGEHRYTALTEFYLSPEYLQADIAANLHQDTLNVPLIIANHEGQAITYHIEAQAGKAMAWQSPDITVEPDKLWSETIAIPLKNVKGYDFVDINLFSSAKTEPIGALRISLTGLTRPQ